MTWIGLFLVIAVLFLAYSNGANDNFKGVATLYGSRTAGYRRALAWATLATLAGSLMSILVAHGLVQAFSGNGLIAAEFIDQRLLTAVGAAAAATILIATFLGMPTSTTHALTGALVGAALVANPGGVNWATLNGNFAQPLLLSPILAIAATAAVYPLLHLGRRKLGIEAQTCICIGDAPPRPLPAGVSVAGQMAALAQDERGAIAVEIGTTPQCVERYAGRFVGIEAQPAVDAVHYLSAGAVCFARAVNDTPKIAALMLAAGAVGAGSPTTTLALVTVAVVAGGLIQSRKVAETMSRRITDLNTGQGLTANLVTAVLVLGASRLGMPVSTTHVSCGSIFGIGLVNRRARWKTIVKILATWITTLPMGLALGALLYWLAV